MVEGCEIWCIASVDTRSVYGWEEREGCHPFMEK